jgi:hypothetical protein
MRVHADLSPPPSPSVAGNGRADGKLQPGMSYAAWPRAWADVTPDDLADLLARISARQQADQAQAA